MHRVIRASSAFAVFVGVSVVAGILVAAAVTPAIAVTGMASNLTIKTYDDLPEYLTIQKLDQTSTMFANQGGHPVPIATFYAQNRVEVGWNDIAQSVKDAAVATEDPRFYEHGGVDLLGTTRGAIETYLKHNVQGGSSITQQYVKNVLVQKCEVDNVTLSDPAKQAAADKKYKACYDTATDDTPGRKLREMKYAIGMEKRYSKDQILQAYLNISGFGGRVYGIQAAAEYYFGVSAKDVDLPQAATLIAILNNPNYLRIDGESVKPRAASLDNTAKSGFAAVKQRRDYALDQMLKEHKITVAEHDTALKSPVTPAITPVKTGCMAANVVNAGAFCDYVERVILSDPAFGKTADARTAAFLRGGLKIYTTLNLDLQSTAQAALNQYVPQTMPGVDIGGTNVSVEVGTGRIVTMVQNQPFDNTDSAAPGTTSVNYNAPFAYGNSQGFQTGSTWKMFDLIQWLREGHSLNEVIDGSRSTFPQSMFHESAPCDSIGGAPWNVLNDDGPAGRYSVLEGTAESVNTVFASMSTKLDLCGIKQAAQSLLVDAADADANPFIANPSFVLGTNYIAPISMAVAYAGIANHGTACSAIAIDRITDGTGKELPVPKSACSTDPIDPSIAASVIYALQGVMQHGTGTIANPHDGTPIFGKTGTTDHAFDNWFVSSTTKVAQATWVGNIQGTPDADGTAVKTSIRDLTLGGRWGGDAKLYISREIIAALNAAYGGDAFPKPDAGSLRSPEPPVRSTPTQIPTPPAAPPAGSPLESTPQPTAPSS
jgi:membrane peptidoglycan carboxypeptidase